MLIKNEQTWSIIPRRKFVDIWRAATNAEDGLEETSTPSPSVFGGLLDVLEK